MHILFILINLNRIRRLRLVVLAGKRVRSIHPSGSYMPLVFEETGTNERELSFFARGSDPSIGPGR